VHTGMASVTTLLHKTDYKLPNTDEWCLISVYSRPIRTAARVDAAAPLPPGVTDQLHCTASQDALVTLMIQPVSNRVGGRLRLTQQASLQQLM